ncbi:MAG: hypothetical protein P1U89_16190 [Verrucomicrobiales bacterium]|nr:hypothetical protein [Verrucomicrobiales bacterium]
MKSLTIDIPEEAAQIKDLRERLEWFVEEQVKLDQWRQQRFPHDVEELVNEAYDEADRLKSEGLSMDQAREEFVKLWREFNK